MTEVATGRRTPSGVVTTATPLAVAVGMEDDASGRGGASGGGCGLSEDDGAVHGCGACLFAE